MAIFSNSQTIWKAMSVQHHGDMPEDMRRMLQADQSQLVKRFMEQSTGSYDRKFPNGRIGAEDDGELTYAITNDDRKRVIVIKFAHPTEWIGLDVKAATELRDQLTERIFALRGITA
jgi:hypothetical protein